MLLASPFAYAIAADEPPQILDRYLLLLENCFEVIDLSLLLLHSPNGHDAQTGVIQRLQTACVGDEFRQNTLNLLCDEPELCRGRLVAGEVIADRPQSERFREEIGLTPKSAARVFRFERACRLIKDERPRLAQVASACGYYDQAHMTREWNALTGCSPNAWIASELPFLQDYELAGRDNGWESDAAYGVKATLQEPRHDTTSLTQPFL